MLYPARLDELHSVPWTEEEHLALVMRAKTERMLPGLEVAE